jgi:hypothetical protein
MSHPDTWDAAEQAYERAMAYAYGNCAGELQAERDIARLMGEHDAADAFEVDLHDTLGGCDESDAAIEQVQADLAKPAYRTIKEARDALAAMQAKSLRIALRVAA